MYQEKSAAAAVLLLKSQKVKLLLNGPLCGSPRKASGTTLTSDKSNDSKLLACDSTRGFVSYFLERVPGGFTATMAPIAAIWEQVRK